MTVDTSATSGQRAVIGGWVCLALGTVVILWSGFSFLLCLPLFFVAFVLGIVAIAQQRIWHGIPTLLLSVIVPIVIGFGLATPPTQQVLEPLKKPFNSPELHYRIHDFSLQTRYGKLKTAPGDDGDVLKLNGKIISGICDDVLKLEKYFKLKNKDVILISENSMGNGSEGPFYAFITIFPDRSYTVELEKILNRDYYNSYMDSATQQEEIITVTFKRRIDKSIESIITYNEGKLSIEKFDSRPTEGPAAEKNCKGLYEIYENCGDSSACNLSEMSMADKRNFDYYSQDKRLKTGIIDKLCGAVCATKKRIGYQKFKKEICGY